MYWNTLLQEEFHINSCIWIQLMQCCGSVIKNPAEVIRWQEIEESKIESRQSEMS